MPNKHKINVIITISKLMNEIDNELIKRMQRKSRGAGKLI
jgi:hypothetical protein